MKIKNREELIAKQEEYRASLNSQRKQILICAGTGCVAGGSLEIYAKMKDIIEGKGLKCALVLEKDPHGDSIGLKKSGCHGFCEMGPLLRIEPMGWLYIKVSLDDCEEIIEKSIIGDEVIDRLVYKDQEGNPYVKQEDIPFYKQQTRIALEYCGHINAESIAEYLALGGYSAVAKALFDMTPQGIVDEITESCLRGRGGGGFPAGRKWQQVLDQKEEEKYIVCNGDEGDPGAFMDRSMMEGEPHRVIEGMLIAAIATGARHGYIYVRAEYPLAVERLQTAIDSIEFDHVDFSYKKQSGEPVLKDINLQIASGETIGILGGTGSAKSSLVNLVSRLYDVTEGSVRVGGVDVRNYGVEALRNQVAVVLQNNVLFSGTILDNLRWGDPEATEEECKHACELACADEFIQKMPKGYHTYIEQGGTNVSGGQKQRLSIARALVRRPRILILDDSTSALDYATDAKLRKAIRELTYHPTTFIVSQRTSSICYADEIIVLDDGEVVGIGNHEQLMEQCPVYQEIHQSQFQDRKEA